MRANVFQRWPGTAACSVKHGVQQIQERLDEDLRTVFAYCTSEVEVAELTLFNVSYIVRSGKGSENSNYKSIIRFNYIENKSTCQLLPVNLL